MTNLTLYWLIPKDRSSRVRWLLRELDAEYSEQQMNASVGIRRHEGLSLGFVGLQEMFLRPLEDKTQPMQVVQATATAEHESEAFLDKSPYHFPVTTRQVDACLFGQSLYRSLQLGTSRFKE